jgi:hypothetical protein
MLYLLVALTAIHGIAHWAGYSLIRGRGGAPAWASLWVGLGVGWLILSAGILWRANWWLPVLTLLTLVSLVCCAVEWRDARFGLLANVLVLGLACWVLSRPGNRLALTHPALEALWQDASGPRVRLRMRGEIKLGQWFPFEAEQVIHARRGMVWAANVSMFGLPVIGADTVLDGHGQMQWQLFGLIPVATASGPDIDRSALARYQGEAAAWMPGVPIENFGPPLPLTTHRNPAGQIVAFSFPRWGNPDGQPYRLHPFGVVVEEFRGVPTRIRAGWFYGTPRFESEGLFFRAHLTLPVESR